MDWLRREARVQGFALPDPLPTGAIIGVVTLVDCVTEHPSEWFNGPIGWVLADPGVLDAPIPASGRLGLWDADIEFEWE